MDQKKLEYETRHINRPSNLRLIRAIILETLLVALIGLAVWGFAWELGYPSFGLITAVIIWVTVSPVIEILTVASFRRSGQNATSIDEHPVN